MKNLFHFLPLLFVILLGGCGVSAGGSESEKRRAADEVPDHFEIRSVGHGDTATTYKINTRTGDSWRYIQGSWRRMSEELPPAEMRKIEKNGNSQLHNGVLEGKLVNNSNWIVTKVEIEVTNHGSVKEKTCRFTEFVSLTPNTAGTFQKNVSEGYETYASWKGINDASWSVHKVFGYRE